MRKPSTSPQPAPESAAEPRPRSRSRARAATGAGVERHADDAGQLQAEGPVESQPAAIAQGWHQLSDEAYHADPCPAPSLSASIANLVINRSLMHAWRAHPKSPVYEATTLGAAADRGSAAHALLFGGRRIAPIAADDYRTSAAREARDQARAAGETPILARELDDLNLMAAPARERFAALHGLPFLAEQSALWRMGQGGWRRARLDTLSADRTLIVDYKTTEGAVDGPTCERRIADMGLQIQAAAYVEAVETLHPELQGRVRFMFQWQEQKPPFALSPPIEMSEAFMALGRAQWQAAAMLWDKALRHQAFPGHSAMPYPACPPPWELSRWEERAPRETLPSGASA